MDERPGHWTAEKKNTFLQWFRLQACLENFKNLQRSEYPALPGTNTLEEKPFCPIRSVVFQKDLQNSQQLLMEWFVTHTISHVKPAVKLNQCAWIYTKRLLVTEDGVKKSECFCTREKNGLNCVEVCVSHWSRHQKISLQLMTR